jgi:hypothetical protein
MRGQVSHSFKNMQNYNCVYFNLYAFR